MTGSLILRSFLRMFELKVWTKPNCLRLRKKRREMYLSTFQKELQAKTLPHCYNSSSISVVAFMIRNAAPSMLFFVHKNTNRFLLCSLASSTGENMLNCAARSSSRCCFCAALFADTWESKSIPENLPSTAWLRWSKRGSERLTWGLPTLV